MVWYDRQRATEVAGNFEPTEMTCAYCGSVGRFSGTYQRDRQITGFRRNFQTFRCDDCGNECFVVAEIYPDGVTHYRIYPTEAAPIEAHRSWPERVASAYIQAERAVANGSWDAAGAMARRSVQAALRDLQAKPGNISAEIEELGKKGMLTPSLVDWAHQVRLLAQVASHPDDEEPPVMEEDARDVVAFTRYFLTYVYTVPAEISEQRQRRSQLKNAGA